jgi:hypothetical protein
MSAYVNRLLDRFSPAASGDMPASVNPFVRSQSPIAQFDQRPDGEDSLEFESVAGPEDSAELAAPDPGLAPSRIQRKAVSAPAPATPSVNVSPPASAPTPEAPASARALAPEAPAPVVAAPRREPMDPGPLFDPFRRFFAAEQAKSAAPHVVETEPGPSPASPQPQALAFPATPAPARVPELRAPIEAPAPWHPLEPEVPAPTTARFLAPTKPREHAPERPTVAPTFAPAPESEPRPNVVHYATPRANPRTPFVPDPGPGTAEFGATTRPSVHIGRVEIEVVPNPASASAQSKPAPSKPLTIDSISQIGPLARHFPNRRLFRLRYR